MKFSLIVLLATSCLNLVAQVEPEESAEPERTCRLYFLSRPTNAPKEAYVFDGTTSHKVYLSGKGFSDPIQLPSGDITLGISSESVDTPEEFPEGAPSAAIPANQEDIFMLLYSDLENKVFPVKMKAINVDDDKLKPGEILWINLSKHNVRAKLGDHEVSILAMKQSISRPPRKDNGYYPAKFIYQHNGQGDYRKVLNKTWRFQMNSKSLGFIIDTGGRRPEIFTIRDRRTAKAPSATQ